MLHGAACLLQSDGADFGRGFGNRRDTAAYCWCWCSTLVQPVVVSWSHDSLEALMRIDDPTIYNPFGWRLAEIGDPTTGSARRRELAESLMICEAEELVLGRRHVTVVHGDPDMLADSRHLTAFYDTVAGLASAAEWARVRGAVDYVTVTFGGPDAERMISLVATAAERANPGWWNVRQSAYPDVT